MHQTNTRALAGLAILCGWLAPARICYAAGPAESGPRERIRTTARTPALEGADELERAPILTLTSTTADLDGRSVDEDQLKRELGVIKRNYESFWPDKAFPGMFLVVCSPDTQGDRLRKYLLSAHAAGYGKASFAFLREIGNSGWSTGTAVRAVLRVQPPPRSGEILLARFDDYGAFAKALVSARAQRGSAVVSLLESRRSADGRPTRR